MSHLSESSIPEKKVVFLLGIGRSGSTMLDLMLGSHSQGFSLGEISKIPEILAKEGTPAAFCPDTTFWQDRFSVETAQRLAAGLSNHRLHKYIPLKLERWVRELIGKDDILRPYSLLFEKIQKPLLIDSSKYPYWVASKLNTAEFRRGPLQAYVLHVVRDGRAVLNSYLRAFPHLSVDYLSQRWLQNLDESMHIYDNFPDQRKMRVRYENLATDPEGTMRSVCQWLGIPFEPSMLEYWKHEHHHVVGSRSARAMMNRYRNQPVSAQTQQIYGNYYQKMNLGIRLDQRWRRELDSAKLERFYELVGDRNQPFEWNEQE